MSLDKVPATARNSPPCLQPCHLLPGEHCRNPFTLLPSPPPPPQNYTEKQIHTKASWKGTLQRPKGLSCFWMMMNLRNRGKVILTRWGGLVSRKEMRLSLGLTVLSRKLRSELFVHWDGHAHFSLSLCVSLSSPAPSLSPFLLSSLVCGGGEGGGRDDYRGSGDGDSRPQAGGWDRKSPDLLAPWLWPCKHHSCLDPHSLKCLWEQEAQFPFSETHPKTLLGSHNNVCIRGHLEDTLAGKSFDLSDENTVV